jgi:hypothetical protein
MPPGSTSRGRGGKFKKYKRGGPKNYSSSLHVQDNDGNDISMWSAEAQEKLALESEHEDDDQSDGEDNTASNDDGQTFAQLSTPYSQDETREQRKEAKKARKAAILQTRARQVQVGDMPSDSEDDVLSMNPNHSDAARKQAVETIDDAYDPGDDGGERKAKEDDIRQIDDAVRKSDLERLAEIREKRELARLRKEVSRGS